MDNQDIQIEKHSDTQVVITRQVPQQTTSDISSKTEVIARIEYVKNSKKDTEQILAERIQSFDKEIEELQIILNKMDAEGIKTDYEVAEEIRIQAEAEAQAEAKRLEEEAIPQDEPVIA